MSTTRARVASEIAHECLDNIIVRALEKGSAVPEVSVYKYLVSYCLSYPNFFLRSIYPDIQQRPGSYIKFIQRIPYHQSNWDHQRYIRSPRLWTMSSISKRTQSGEVPNARIPQEKQARQAMLISKSPEEKDVLTAIWYQVTTIANLTWTVTATDPMNVKPATFSEALKTASQVGPSPLIIKI